MLGLYHFVLIKKSVCLAKVNADIPADVSLNDTCNNILILCKILIVDNVSFFFTYLLKDNVLGSLGCDTSEFLGLDLDVNSAAYTDTLLDLLSLFLGDHGRGIIALNVLIFNNLFLRIAQKLPVGSQLEYADEVTLLRALEGRREI